MYVWEYKEQSILSSKYSFNFSVQLLEIYMTPGKKKDFLNPIVTTTEVHVSALLSEHSVSIWDTQIIGIELLWYVYTFTVV